MFRVFNFKPFPNYKLTPTLSKYLERENMDFFPKFLGKTDFLRGQELIANIEALLCLFEYLERQDCSVNAIAFALSNLVSLKLCLDF